MGGGSPTPSENNIDMVLHTSRNNCDFPPSFPSRGGGGGAAYAMPGILQGRQFPPHRPPHHKDMDSLTPLGCKFPPPPHLPNPPPPPPPHRHHHHPPTPPPPPPHHHHHHPPASPPPPPHYHHHPPAPPPPPPPPRHQMKQIHYGHCCLHGHHNMFTHPMSMPITMPAHSTHH